MGHYLRLLETVLAEATKVRKENVSKAKKTDNIATSSTTFSLTLPDSITIYASEKKTKKGDLKYWEFGYTMGSSFSNGFATKKSKVSTHEHAMEIFQDFYNELVNSYNSNSSSSRNEQGEDIIDFFNDIVNKYEKKHK